MQTLLSSNLTALTIQFQVRDVLYAADAGLTDNEAAFAKVNEVLVLLEQFLQISVNLKTLNVVFLMAGASLGPGRNARYFAHVFYNKVDRLLSIEGQLVRGRSRSSKELFDDDGILITRALDSFYITGRTDGFKWKAPRGQGLRVVCPIRCRQGPKTNKSKLSVLVEVDI
jgi:hypothetical protein